MNKKDYENILEYAEWAQVYLKENGLIPTIDLLIEEVKNEIKSFVIEDDAPTIDDHDDETQEETDFRKGLIK